MFICGSRSFNHEDGDKNGSNIAKKTSKKSKSFSRFIGKDYSTKKNPYADRGLDKFYTLLSDLEDKKQKIYSQMGVEEICFVRFVYSEDSERIRPIVVKVKNKNSQIKLLPNHVRTCNPTAESCEEIDDRSKENGTTTTEEMKKEELMKIYHRRWNNIRRLSRSYYCFAVMIVLILLCLAIYGRSFAILCTTITWYLVPRINIRGCANKH